MMKRFTFTLAACVCFSGALLSAEAQGHHHFPSPPSMLRPTFHPGAHPKVEGDRAALGLIRQMLHPLVNYSGEQVTEVTDRGGRQSRQKIWGDTRGRLRRDFLSPNDLNGDIMVTAPDQYRYFHHRTNTLDVALWPGTNDPEKQLPDLIRQRRVLVSRIGQEIVAGRTAEIVAVSLDNGNGRQIKFWIDGETGVRLKQEISSGAGLVSRSYLTSIALGEAAGVDSKIFDPSFGNAKLNALFPPTSRFSTVEEARGLLSFAPVLPASLPWGFGVTGVWVFPSRNPKLPENSSILLRYSNGIETFSLFEKPRRGMNAPAKTPKIGRRSVLRWGVTVSGGQIELTYVGHLTPDQAQQMIESLR